MSIQPSTFPQFGAPNPSEVAASILPPERLLLEKPEIVGKLALSPELEQAAHVVARLVEDRSDFKLRPSSATSLVEEAMSGVEAEHQIIRGTFVGDYQGVHSNRRALDEYFKDTGRQKTWSIIDDYGHYFDGPWVNSLRDEAGYISNAGFINQLNTGGVAVVNSQRKEGSFGRHQGKDISVTNVWRLLKDADGQQLPVARVLSIDSDASSQARSQDARPIHISEKLVVFPNLQIPQVPAK